MVTLIHTGGYMWMRSFTLLLNIKLRIVHIIIIIIIIIVIIVIYKTRKLGILNRMEYKVSLSCHFLCNIYNVGHSNVASKLAQYHISFEQTHTKQSYSCVNLLKTNFKYIYFEIFLWILSHTWISITTLYRFWKLHLEYFK